MLFGQLFFDGLVMGLVYVILATGMVLIMSTSRILFMAYGMFYTIGAYSVWYAVKKLDLPYFISLPIGVLAAGMLGIISYLLIFQKLQKSEGGFLATLIASMGLSMVLNQSGIIVFGTASRSLPMILSGRFDLFGINVSADKLLLIGLGVAITFLLFWIYEKTNIGRAMRALSFNSEIALLQGINANRMYMVVMGMGTGLAGFAGGILAPSYGLTPTMGTNILWMVFLMTMLGGMDSLMGAVIGGVIIGQVLSFGQYFIGSTIQIVLFLIIGIILYFKPAGLLGRGIEIEI